MDEVREEHSSMKRQLKSCLKIPALGRSFNLGMLYDCIEEKTIPSLKLWDKDKLEKNIDIIKDERSSSKIVTVDTTENKIKALEVAGDLKLSLYANLFKASGSAKYLHDMKSSLNKQRVAVTYKYTTRSKELTMSHLAEGKVQYGEIFDRHILATHVVIKIGYGGQANFVLELRNHSSKQEKEIKQKLNVLAKRLSCKEPSGAEQNLQLVITEEEINQFLNVDFYGDFKVPYNPSTFEDACNLYKELPSLIDESNEKPIEVWLYPLKMLDTRAITLERKIDEVLIKNVGNIIENIQKHQTTCSDILAKSEAYQLFPNLKKKIHLAMTHMEQFETYIMGKLQELVPDIRVGKAQDSDLNNLIKNLQLSPFTDDNLSQLLKYFDRESKVLEEYFNITQENRIKPHEDVISNPRIKYTVSLLHCDFECDYFLNCMEQYLDNNSKDYEGKNEEKFHASVFDKRRPAMLKNADLLMRLYRANDTVPSTQFSIGELDNGGTENETMICYHINGEVKEGYKPPGKPYASKAETEICLQWDPAEPEFSFKNKYEIQYTPTDNIKWSSLFSDTNEVKVRVPVPQKMYQFKVRALGEKAEDIGIFSEISEEIQISRFTLFLQFVHSVSEFLDYIQRFPKDFILIKFHFYTFLVGQLILGFFFIIVRLKKVKKT